MIKLQPIRFWPEILRKMPKRFWHSIRRRHRWCWVETELGGSWGTPYRRHYECSCGAWKVVD